MIRYSAFILSIFIINGCSIFGASEKLFPEKQYDFLEEKKNTNVYLRIGKKILKLRFLPPISEGCKVQWPNVQLF